MLLLQAATASRGKKLVGTEVAARIETFSQVFHRGQITFRKHFVHEVDFLHTNAMLSRDRTAAVQALIQNLVTGEQDSLDLSSVPLIEQQDGMDVAVPGMKDIDDSQFMFRGDFDNSAENVRQLGARNNTVLGAVTRAEPADGAEGLLAALPKFLPFFVPNCQTDLAGITLFAEVDDAVPLFIEPCFQSVDFNEQNRLGIQGKAE